MIVGSGFELAGCLACLVPIAIAAGLWVLVRKGDEIMRGDKR
jgi:hypothetical protein